MFEPLAVDSLDASGCARALEESVVEQRRAGARRLALTAQWADLHYPGPDRRRRGVRGVRIGAEGTPEVTEFAATELGLLLGTSTVTASHLLRDVLDLRHRLPHTWQATLTGEVEDWKARQLARATNQLTLDQARWVDSEVVEALRGLPYGRALNVIDGKVIAADPAGHDQRRRVEAERRYVAKGRRDNPSGLRTLVARTTAGDVARL